MLSIEEMKNDYDWKEAFGYAKFSIDDVASIIKTSEGENDGANWLAVGMLNNGEFFILSAGCDYTGWDCQAGGDSESASTLEDLIRWRMSDDDRTLLGYELPPETEGAPLPVIEDDRP